MGLREVTSVALGEIDLNLGLYQSASGAIFGFNRYFTKLLAHNPDGSLLTTIDLSGQPLQQYSNIIDGSDGTVVLYGFERLNSALRIFATTIHPDFSFTTSKIYETSIASGASPTLRPVNESTSYLQIAELTYSAIEPYIATKTLITGGIAKNIEVPVPSGPGVAYPPVILQNGELLFAWNSGAGTKYARFGADGVRKSADFLIENMMFSRSDILTDGRPVVVGLNSIQLFDKEGNADGGVVIFGQGAEIRDFCQLPDGRIMCFVTTYDNSRSTYKVDIFELYDDHTFGAVTVVDRQLSYDDLQIAGIFADGNSKVALSLAGEVKVYDLAEFSGTAGDDTWSGTQSNNLLQGLSGNDKLFGMGGADTIDGGEGVDTASYKFDGSLTLSLDGSLVVGGSAIGDQLISIENLVGSEKGDDTLAGDAADNVIDGSGGHNTLYGRAGNDTFVGGAGTNVFNGEDGTDTVSYADTKGVRASLADPSVNTGESQGDTYFSIENLIGSRTDNDDLVGNDEANLILGLGGDDYLIGGKGADTLDGGEGDNTAGYYYTKKGVTVALDKSVAFKGEAKGDILINIKNLEGSDKGNDVLIGDKFKNVLWGDGGNDKLSGKAGGDYLIGGKGADTLDGGKGEDGVDYYNAKAVHAALDGSFANTGEAKGDKYISIEDLFGSRGNDWLSGDSQHNYVYGNGGNDKLYGRGGNDVLEGGIGTDTLNGGAGYDSFYFFRPAYGSDVISDFKHGEDALVFQHEYFGNLPHADSGLESVNFVSHATNQATNAQTLFIFRTGDNTLWFDGDGTGNNLDSVLIAKLNTAIVYADIFIN